MKTSGNVQEVKLSDGRRVCLSYGVIVAAFIPHTGQCLLCKEEGNTVPLSQAGEHHKFGPVSHKYVSGGYVRTDARFSVTTSKHMNAFAGKDALCIPHGDLLALCAPVESRQ